jgi:ubiquitin thioesterase protein OTUB1
MGRECDEMQIIAISEYLGVSVDIEYLDGRAFDSHLSVVHCEGRGASGSERGVTLLYRPGHYDVLYR